MPNICPDSAAPSVAPNGAAFLRKTTDFDLVFAHRACCSTSFLALHYRPNTLHHPRLGLGVARRVSTKATRRNRIKRLLRELFRAHLATLPALDIVAVVRPAAAHLSNGALRDAFSEALSRLPVLPAQRPQ